MATSVLPQPPPPPALMVNGEPAHVTAEPIPEYFRYTGNGLVPITNTNNDLGRLLRAYCVMDGIDAKFWTERLLRHILTTQRLRHELRKPEYMLKDLQVEEYVVRIHPSLGSSSSTAYIKIFALLVLLDRVPDIKHFMNEQVDDQVLPIGINGDRVYPLRQPGRRLQCFDTWKPSEQEHFEQYQWMIDTPYFHSSQGHPLTELILQKSTRKPWRRVRRKDADRSDGAYGTVIQVEIHPTAHSYEQVLRGINLDCTTFAVKTLHQMPANTEQAFLREWEMLKHFSGLNHPHLVTALSAFKQEDDWSFIFPYAPCNFGEYKETISPPQGRSGAIWVAAQLAGLIGAIDTMHNPRHLHLGPERKYGRHGDIKCDNVLCFRKSGTHNEVILVISDFGLSAYNSDKSRSNIPNQKVPPVPGYRPPECDILGGTVSRAFDIWTIGCLFLELVTWFLGGPQYVEEFRKQRTTQFINGALNDIFFTFNDLETGIADGYKAILVKPEVTTWIHNLRCHPNCSQFLHDSLVIVEREMLVVLSKDKQRSSSGDLRKAFDRVFERCKSEEKYTQGKPWTHEQLREAQDDIARGTVAVQAIPSDNAAALIDMKRTSMSVHHGQTQMSLGPEQYNEMDRIRRV